MVTSTVDIDPTLPARTPCVYYFILPDAHFSGHFIAATFLSFLFLDLLEYADNSPDRKCKVPVNFLLDDFANIGFIPEFDRKLMFACSRGVNVSVILQDIPQLAKRYPKTYQTILANCGTYLCMGCCDEETYKFFSHHIGKTNDEMICLGWEECLIVWQGLCAMRMYKYPYIKHPEAARMKMISLSDYPKITEDEVRRKLRDEEMKRVRDYEEKLRLGGDLFAYFYQK